MTAVACQRPGCPGHYAEDWYCDECGHRAPASMLASVTGATSGAPSVGTPSVAATSLGATMVSGTPSGAGLAGASSGGTRGTRGHTRGRLGANLVVVPPVTPKPPASAVLSDPAVPENQRYCGKCGEPVGRGRDGQPGRVEGFCPRDRTRYNFRPKLSPGELPATECLKDTVARFLPFWESDIAPAIKRGERVLVTAHGNSLRALVKYLDNVSDEDIVELNIPTGIPLVYELDDNLKPIKPRYYLGDPEAAEKAAKAVANQGKA